MKLIKSGKGKPATVAEIAATEFKAAKELKAMPLPLLKRRCGRSAKAILAAADIAAAIIRLDKDVLIAKVKRADDKIGPMLMELAKAANEARGLHQLLSAAEVRLAVALAVVEGDELRAAGEV